MDKLRECPRARITNATATEAEIRAAAAEAAKYPDADVSMPAWVLLRLLDDRHIVGKRLARAEESANRMRRAEADSLRAIGHHREHAEKMEAHANSATNRLMAIIQKCHEANSHFVDCLAKNRRISKRVYDAWRADLRKLGDEARDATPPGGGHV